MQCGQRGRLSGADGIRGADERNAGCLGEPVALPLTSRLAALSAITRVAPDASAKPVSAASEVACAALIVFDVPDSATAVASAIPGIGTCQQVNGIVRDHQGRAGAQSEAVKSRPAWWPARR